jgi:hypothetical protein
MANRQDATKRHNHHHAPRLFPFPHPSKPPRHIPVPPNPSATVTAVHSSLPSPILFPPSNPPFPRRTNNETTNTQTNQPTPHNPRTKLNLPKPSPTLTTNKSQQHTNDDNLLQQHGHKSAACKLPPRPPRPSRVPVPACTIRRKPKFKPQLPPNPRKLESGPKWGTKSRPRAGLHPSGVSSSSRSNSFVSTSERKFA